MWLAYDRKMDILDGVIMRKTVKGFIAILVVLVLCLTGLQQNAKKTYASDSDQYLVIVQQKNGSWKAYDNLVEESDSGSLMIKAKSISKVLGLTYKKYNNGNFVIKRSAKRYNTYNKNSKKYTYTNNLVVSKLEALNITYTSKASKSNVCEAGTLKTLVNYKYFSTAYTKDDVKYKGVLCFSKYESIPVTIPVSDPVPAKTPTPTPQPEPTKIMIEGVEFPVRDSFLSVKNTLSDWGGTVPLWSELELEVDSKIVDTTDLAVSSNKIEFTHMGAGSNGITLVKASEGYKISISVKLGGSVLATQNTSILKAMVTTISSKPTLVYTAIFESFTSGIKHGINEKTYVTVGDCKVKVKLEDGSVIYYIKKA